MASKIDVWNSALRKLGAGRVASVDEDSREAELCRDAYDIIRKRLLRSNPWNFALVRASLVELAGDPLNEWSNNYQLPTGCLKVVMAYPDVRYVIEGREFRCNESEMIIKYVSNFETVNDFDPAFFEVLAYELALDLCTALTDSETRKQTLLAEYSNFKGDALTEDAQENTQNNYLSDDTWINARGGIYAEV